MWWVLTGLVALIILNLLATILIRKYSIHSLNIVDKFKK